MQIFLKIDPRVSELADPEIWHFPLTLLVVLTTLSHDRVRCGQKKSIISFISERDSALSSDLTGGPTRSQRSLAGDDLVVPLYPSTPRDFRHPRPITGPRAAAADAADAQQPLTLT